MRKLALLLRAVNVGGTGKLPMAELTRLLADLGHAEPRTLLASGNAVIGTDLAADVAAAGVAAALKDRLGLVTEVFARDHAELAAVMAANPFADFAREAPSKLLVVFLAGDPPADLSAMARLATQGEQVARGPRCLYLAFPDGAGRSKLASARTEASKGTARNWNTVGKLLAMTGA